VKVVRDLSQLRTKNNCRHLDLPDPPRGLASFGRRPHARIGTPAQQCGAGLTVRHHLQAASVNYRITIGPHAGRKALTLYRVRPMEERPNIPLLARVAGFSLHAATVCEAYQRRRRSTPGMPKARVSSKGAKPTRVRSPPNQAPGHPDQWAQRLKRVFAMPQGTIS
jgi:hypothetical protein